MKTRLQQLGRARWKPLVRIVVSLLLLVYIMHLVDWRRGWSLWPQANLWLLGLAVILLTLERVLSVWKWLLLLRAKGARVSFGRLFIINYVGGFWGLILPSSVSADIVRGYYLARTPTGLARTVSSMVVDRIMSGLALMVLAGLSAWVAGDRFGWVHHRALLVAAMVVGLLLVGWLGRAATRRWIDQRLVQPLTRWRLNERIQAGVRACLEYRQYPGRLAWSFGLSILMQVIRVLIFYGVAESFQVHIPILYYFMFIPLIMVLVMLPVAFSGLGVREGSFVAFFVMVGVSAADAFVISFTVSLLTILTTAVGGIIYLCDKAPAAAGASQKPGAAPS